MADEPTKSLSEFWEVYDTLRAGTNEGDWISVITREAFYQGVCAALVCLEAGVPSERLAEQAREALVDVRISDIIEANPEVTDEEIVERLDEEIPKERIASIRRELAKREEEEDC